MENIKNTVQKLKSNKKACLIIFIVLILVIFFVGFGIGKSVKTNKETLKASTQAKLDSDTEYQKLLEDIDGKQQENEDLKKEAAKLQKEADDKKDIIKQGQDYETKIEDLKKQISDHEAKVNELTGQVGTLEQTITSKQAELDKLNGDIVTAKGQPISLPSGQFVVGEDVPAGRYRISGSSNFVVFTSAGRVYINTILGDSVVGDGDYIGNLQTGQKIENHAPATLTPVE